MLWMKAGLIFALLFTISFAQLSPKDVATRVANQILLPQNHDYFFNWDYGCGIIGNGLWDFVEEFSLPITTNLNSWLDSFLVDPKSYGYQILHDITIPYQPRVGDYLSLFPIAYLARAQYYSKHPSPSYNNATDLKIAFTVAQKYLFEYPYTLPDGTYARTYGWSGEKEGNHTFLWCDDQYMGLTLLSRVAAVQKNIDFMDKAAKMQLTYGLRMIDQTDKIFFHGFNAEDNHHSCCKWGRGNGWALMAHVEVLKALKSFPGHPLAPQVLNLFQTHASGLLSVQSPDGRWHQVVDNTTTFLETSATAMYLWSFIQGVQEGWLSKDKYGDAINKAYAGLITTIDSNGVVNKICEGTGIGTSVEFYEIRGTSYSDSSPGLGSVLIAIAAYNQYNL